MSEDDYSAKLGTRNNTRQGISGINTSPYTIHHLFRSSLHLVFPYACMGIIIIHSLKHKTDMENTKNCAKRAPNSVTLAKPRAFIYI